MNEKRYLPENYSINIDGKLFGCRAYYNSLKDYGIQIFDIDTNNHILFIERVEIPTDDLVDYDTRMKEFIQMVSNYLHFYNVYENGSRG